MLTGIASKFHRRHHRLRDRARIILGGDGVAEGCARTRRPLIRSPDFLLVVTSGHQRFAEAAVSRIESAVARALPASVQWRSHIET